MRKGLFGYNRKDVHALMNDYAKRNQLLMQRNDDMENIIAELQLKLAVADARNEEEEKKAEQK